jgi:hypothetical protein
MLFETSSAGLNFVDMCFKVFNISARRFIKLVGISISAFSTVPYGTYLKIKLSGN